MFESIKAFGFGGIGWFAKLAMGRSQSTVAEIRAVLLKTDELATDADRAARSIASGAPDIQLSIRVSTLRTDLGIALKRCLGRTPGFSAVTTAQGLFAASLLVCDPANGATVTDADIETIRQRQQALRAAIAAAASDLFSWRHLQHAAKP